MAELVDRPEVDVADRPRRFYRELVSGCINGMLIIGEVGRKIIRDERSDAQGTDQAYQLLHRSDFIFNHVGDVYETGLLIFGSRTAIETVDAIRGAFGYEKISPRLKMWASVLIGVAIPSAIEVAGIGVGGNTAGPDVFDALGPVLSGILVGGSWELVDFLGKAENRASLVQKTLRSVSRGTEAVRGAFENHVKQMEGAMDYLSMEARVAELMLEDFLAIQSKRIDSFQRTAAGIKTRTGK